jgi:hypothetical protein
MIIFETEKKGGSNKPYKDENNHISYPCSFLNFYYLLLYFQSPPIHLQSHTYQPHNRATNIINNPNIMNAPNVLTHKIWTNMTNRVPIP